MDDTLNYIPFTGRDFRESAERKRSIIEHSSRRINPALLKLLVDFNRTLPTSPARERNIKALSDPKSVVVFTGQQCGLFGGPLFSLYKILHAIKYAASLTEETGVTAIPIFWCQSEDHDFLEINSSYLPSTRGEIVRLTHPPTQEERISAQYCEVTSAVEPLFTQMQEQLHHFLFGDAQLKTLRSCYQPGRTFAQAFIQYYADILRDYGLLFFNPRLPGISELIQPLLFKAYSDRKVIGEMLASRTSELESKKLTAQVHVREDSPLFFYHHPDSQGSRYRLRESEKTFSCIGGEISITCAQIEKLLREEPARFSSSALLRPVVQDFLFPTAAYVGGEAEVRYFAQISPLFEHFSLPSPLIALRNSFTMVEARVQELITSLSLAPEDFTLSESELEQRIASHQTHGGISITQMRSKLSAQVEEIERLLQASLLAVDQTLLNPIQKTRAKIDQQLEVLLERYAKAITNKDSITAERVQRIKRILRPEGIAQERFYGPSYFLARYGEVFIKNTFEAIEPFAVNSKNIYI